MLLLALFHACWPRPAFVDARRARPGPIGLLASPAFWLGGLASAALWALAIGIGIAFG